MEVPPKLPPPLSFRIKTARTSFQSRTNAELPEQIAQASCDLRLPPVPSDKTIHFDMRSIKMVGLLLVEFSRNNDIINSTNLNLSVCKVMLRKCKVDAVVFFRTFSYNEVITTKEVLL